MNRYSSLAASTTAGEKGAKLLSWGVSKQWLEIPQITDSTLDYISVSQVPSQAVQTGLQQYPCRTTGK